MTAVFQRLVRPAFWIALAGAFYFAVIPQVQAIEAGNADKLLHIFAFLVLGFLGALAYPRTPLMRIGVLLALFGALIEVVQGTPLVARDASVWDWVADACALVVSLSLVAAGRRR